MSGTLVQTGTALNVGGGTSGTITLTSVGAGSLLVVYADDIDGAGISFSVSDDKGNTWASAVSNDNGGYSSAILYCLNAVAGTTVITVTASGSTSFLAQAQEWNGGTWTLDTTSSIDESSTTSHVCSASSSVIDTTGEGLVVCNSTTADGGNFGTRTAGSGYTGLTSPTAQAFWQYRYFTAAQANERGAFTTANSKPTAACIAAFRCTPVSSLPLSLVMFCISVLTGCWWPCCYAMLCYYYYTYIGSFFTYTNCDQCPGVILADCWQITVTGIAAGNANCPNLNGTWILDRHSPASGDAFLCTVRGVDITGPNTFACVGSETGRWKLGHTSSGTTWVLCWDGDAGAIDVSGELDDSVFDCVEPNTFTMSASGSNCCINYPATITATPVPC